MVFFSIIIPTYNSSKTIKSAIASILNQSFTNFEVLIIDGLSTDNTLEIIGSFNDNRIALVSGKDDGIYDAMNKGIKCARGEWFYFLGGDDELFNQNILSLIFGAINEDVEFIYGNIMARGNDGWMKDGSLYDGRFTLKKLGVQNICHQAIFYKKTLFERFGVYDTRYKLVADWHFNIKVFTKCEVAFVDMVIARYNILGASSQKIIDDPFDYERALIVKNEFNLSLLSSYYKANEGDIHKLLQYYKMHGQWLNWLFSYLRIRLNQV